MTIFPCAKCNGLPQLVIFPGRIGHRAVQCKKCHFQGETKSNQAEAIKHWNSLFEKVDESDVIQNELGL